MCRSFTRLVWVLVIHFVTSVQSTACDISPLVLPIRNAYFNVGGITAVNRGIAVILDNQVLGLRPTFCWNGTRIRSAQDCPSSSTDLGGFNGCQGASGSVYDASSPNSFTPIGASAWAVPDPPPLGAHYIFGEASAGLDSGKPLIIPFEVWSKTDFGSATPNKSFIALGPDSNFLQALLNDGRIPSKTIGIFYGSRSVANPSDGEGLLWHTMPTIV
jgi:hypothetical protein